MKAIIFISAILILSLSALHAQINNPLKVVKEKVNHKANNEIDKAADEIVNPDLSGNSGNGENSSNQTTTTTAEHHGNGADGPGIKVYANYDFVAGDKLVFEDDFRSDMDGEFATHWNLINGQAIVNRLGNGPAFFLTDGNYCRVNPLIRSKDYLGNSFTIEYDTYIKEGAYSAMVMFIDEDNHDLGHITVSAGSVDYSPVDGQSFSGSLPAAIQYANFFSKWHHVAIAYKSGQIKVYVDQYRPLVVPAAPFVPATMQFTGIGDLENPIIIKNVRIAQGGDMNMLTKVTTNGRIVTHNIVFDYNETVIKPESMGEINLLYKMLKENADFNFLIEGHTDSDGEEVFNLKLSQERADAVKQQLVDMGVNTARLTTKGMGESKPLSPNTTSEGKANNRRVEFVKQ